MCRENMINTRENFDYRIHTDIWQQGDILDHHTFAWIVYNDYKNPLWCFLLSRCIKYYFFIFWKIQVSSRCNEAFLDCLGGFVYFWLTKMPFKQVSHAWKRYYYPYLSYRTPNNSQILTRFDTDKVLTIYFVFKMIIRFMVGKIWEGKYCTRI